MSMHSDSEKTLDEEAIRNFQEYLQIPSVHPNVNYVECVKFLRLQAETLNLPLKIFEGVVGKPVIIITWTGTDLTSPSVMLNSHMDVVGVYEENWIHKPFAADIDDKGNIYGRGAQDAKCIGIQYLEAIRRMRRDGVQLNRTIHVTFVPDEETGGVDGMGKFVHSAIFKDMNVGVVLDEGMTTTEEDFVCFYGEKSPWQLHFHCAGTTGHGAMLPDNTAAEKVQYIINKMLQFREKEKRRLAGDPKLSIIDVTVVNLTGLSGGVQSSVIPAEFTAVFDCRLPPTADFKKWENTLDQWCREAGENVRIEYALKQPSVPLSKIDDSNPYWVAFKEVMDEMDMKLKPSICPCTSDSKYIRTLGIPSFGFSPINLTEPRFHDNDEFLNSAMFLNGIKVYYKLIQKMGNLE